ncbi:MAG: hypothetical protein HXY24_11870, partial [Rubrivivax sp.]|nr:hypothetical protein [Rubrivivax sp.]
MRLAQMATLAAVAMLLTAFGCSSGSAPADDDDGNGTPTGPQFSATRAFDDLRSQVAFGPRNPGSAGHDACRRWIIASLESSGAQVTEQTWTFESP